jgi:hypothetical protein
MPLLSFFKKYKVSSFRSFGLSLWGLHHGSLTAAWLGPLLDPMLSKALLTAETYKVSSFGSF